MVCVTHDLEETRGFDRVVVIEDGRIVEQGRPGVLAAAGGRYAGLLASEALTGAGWRDGRWQHRWLEDGRLSGGRGADGRAVDGRASGGEGV